MIRATRDVSRSLRTGGDSGPRGVRHSRRAYSRYFEGCTRYTVPKRNGKGAETVILYTADYYRLDHSAAVCLWRKLLDAAALLAVLGLFVFQAVRDTDYNTTWYVVLPQACAVPFLAAMASAVFRVVWAKRDLTAYCYRASSRRLIASSLGAAAMLMLEALSLILYLLLHREPPAGGLLLAALCYGSLAAVLAAVAVVEKRLRFVRVENRSEPPPGAVVMEKIGQDEFDAEGH